MSCNCQSQAGLARILQLSISKSDHIIVSDESASNNVIRESDRMSTFYHNIELNFFCDIATRSYRPKKAFSLLNHHLHNDNRIIAYYKKKTLYFTSWVLKISFTSMKITSDFVLLIRKHKYRTFINGCMTASTHHNLARNFISVHLIFHN